MSNLRRNDIPLTVTLGGEDVSHFRLREFENREGLAMVHPSVLESLERVRRDLCAIEDEDVWLIITKYGGVRTQIDLERLAGNLGWIDEGGKVSRKSRHLAKYGGIAVDLIAKVASDKHRLTPPRLGKVCRRYFDWVKDDYADGHVHADNRGSVTPLGGGVIE